MRPDPAQRPRLEEIRANLHHRIAEAEREGRLGEIEGLKISLAGTEDKLAQINAALHRSQQAVHLGMPAFPDIAGRSVRQHRKAIAWATGHWPDDPTRHDRPTSPAS